jgi:hypothetical protein
MELPAEAQLQSPLLRLPAEIKHMIYALCFTADETIVNPTAKCDRSGSRQLPALGVALLQTCRRLYREADRRPLYSQNTFRFTTAAKARAFFQALQCNLRSSIHDIEIDVREIHSDHPSLAREWLQYLTWDSDQSGQSLSSLRADAPALKTLRFNFESWPRIPLFRAELWSFLRNLVSDIHGLERVVITGASKGQGMARRDPWSPAHFVGSADLGGDLIALMWNCVGADVDAKIIRWVRSGGRLQLEVVSQVHLLKFIDACWSRPSAREAILGSWPENGSCTWHNYEDHKMFAQSTMKDISPSAAG